MNDLSDLCCLRGRHRARTRDGRRVARPVHFRGTIIVSRLDGHLRYGGAGMRVQCKMFSSSTRSWDHLVAEASEFATSVGHDRLINMSVSTAGGSDLFGVGGQGAIFVWYWE